MRIPRLETLPTKLLPTFRAYHMVAAPILSDPDFAFRAGFSHYIYPIIRFLLLYEHLTQFTPGRS
jgi:hypothetical protein